MAFSERAYVLACAHPELSGFNSSLKDCISSLTAIMGATASKCRVVGERESEIHSLHHHASDSGFPEAIWFEVSKHMSIKAWARVAGTCKVSWGVQLSKVNLALVMPEAGMHGIVLMCSFNG